jgi:hypothetical protein
MNTTYSVVAVKNGVQYEKGCFYTLKMAQKRALWCILSYGAKESRVYNNTTNKEVYRAGD